MYSWWWDSHISPKNSKWLYENLKDMDVKVNQMIRIIEEDADSFGKRAEMYYKRRPELMKLAEDFYRAYRALAERYGHATGVLRHARRTMAEAFPDKIKLNGCDFVRCGEDSDGFPPELSDYEITSVMGLPEEFMSPESKSGFDELHGLFDSLGEEKSCFYARGSDQGLKRAVTGTAGAEKEAVAVELEKCLERLTGLESETARDAELFKKQKELGRLWLCEPEDCLERVDIEDSLQKLKNIWFQFQEETRSLFVQLQGKVQIMEDADSHMEHLQEEICKVQEENAVQHSEMEISSESERLQKLEVDSDKLACILEELHSVGLDPENLVPSIKDLDAKFAETKKNLERERSECVALQEKLVSLDEFIQKNVLLEFSIVYVETQLEEFQDKVQFLEELCESLLEERSNATHERDLLASQSKETIDQNKKLMEMNRQLETSLSEANSQLRALMMRAKVIQDYLQNTEKDYEQLQSKYSVLETEKAALMSEVTQLKIKLKRKEECEEELGKSLDANINDLFPKRSADDVKERNSSLLFKLQTLAEAWKFSQVQISYLEHENLVQQSELKFLSDQIDIGNALLCGMSKWKAVSLEKKSVESDHDHLNNVNQKVHDWHESLSKIEEECFEADIEKSVLCSSLVQMKREAAKVLSDLNTSKIENLCLNNKIAKVESENDLMLWEIMCRKDLLYEKEDRILKADKMLKVMDGEEKKIQRKLYNLKMELANVKLAKEDKEKQISRLSEDLNLQIVESGYLREEIKRMEHRLLDVNKEYHKNCRREEARTNEVKVWEAQATAFFCELIMSGIKEAILEDRIVKVAKANGKEIERGIAEIEQLREMVSRLDDENAELRSRVDAFVLEIKKVNTVSESKGRECETGPVDDDKKKVADMMDCNDTAPEISLAQREFMTKEIVLDQSSGFLYQADGRSLGIEADDRMLELWETSDASGNIDLKVGKPLRRTRTDGSKFDEARKDRSVHNIEKELGTDKQELENKQGASKKRLLERLNTDSQKLTNLHITLNDLQRMVEVIMRTGLERGGEYDAIKAQLDEARATTAKLSQANTKLVKAVEKRFHSRPVRSTSEATADGESFIRRRISEKARKGSEKVTRLQSETQKLQILLLRLGEQKEDKARAAASVVDRKPSVLLKDYLNSRLRSGGHKQKKLQLCACVQLPGRRS